MVQKCLLPLLLSEFHILLMSALTECESHCSQIDEEAIAVYWGLKNFFSYLYSRKVALLTDHKPLVAIFHPERTLPAISGRRIFNYAHFYQALIIKLNFKKPMNMLTPTSYSGFLTKFQIWYEHNRKIPNFTN